MDLNPNSYREGVNRQGETDQDKLYPTNPNNEPMGDRSDDITRQRPNRDEPTGEFRGEEDRCRGNNAMGDYMKNEYMSESDSRNPRGESGGFGEKIKNAVYENVKDKIDDILPRSMPRMPDKDSEY